MDDCGNVGSRILSGGHASDVRLGSWIVFLSLALQGVAFAQLHGVGDGFSGPVKAAHVTAELKAGMRMDVLMLQAGAERGLLTGCPQNPGGNGAVGRMPSVAGQYLQSRHNFDCSIQLCVLSCSCLFGLKGGQDVGCNLLTLDGVPVLGLV